MDGDRPLVKAHITAGNAASLALGFLLLGLLIGAIVTHAAEERQFLELLESARPAWLLVGLLLQGATYFCSSLVWYQVLRQSGHRLSPMSLAPLSLEKLVVDHVIPTAGISGTLMLSIALGRRKVDAVTAASVLAVTFVTFVNAYVLAILLASFVIMAKAGHAKIVLIVVAVALAVDVLVSVTFFLAPNFRGKPKFVQKISRLDALFDDIKNASKSVLRDPKLISQGIALQFAVFVLDSLTLYAMLLATGQHISFLYVFASFVLASVAETIGITPAGLGTFEGGAIGMLVLFGAASGPSLAATLLFRGLTLWLPLFGGVVMFRKELREAFARDDLHHGRSPSETS